MAVTTSSLLFSLAFLYMTPGAIRDAIKQLQEENRIFSYGISDAVVKGLELTKPDGTVSVIGTAALRKNLPEPFKTETSGGNGALMSRIPSAPLSVVVTDRRRQQCRGLSRGARLQSHRAHVGSIEIFPAAPAEGVTIPGFQRCCTE